MASGIRRQVGRLVAPPRNALNRRRSAARLRGALGITGEEILQWRHELQASHLERSLDEKAVEFHSITDVLVATHGKMGLGRVDPFTGLLLYAILRKTTPRLAVETGVCNGFSTAYLLQALAANSHGRLYSLDLPDVVGEGGDEFWSGKGHAVIPPGRQPGWVVPDQLTDRWRLGTGRSQDLLPPLLEELVEIDFFMHDSEHSYECMTFEFDAAYERLANGGLILSDDVAANSAFADFAKRVGRPTIRLTPRIGLIVK